MRGSVAAEGVYGRVAQRCCVQKKIGVVGILAVVRAAAPPPLFVGLAMPQNLLSGDMTKQIFAFGTQ